MECHHFQSESFVHQFLCTLYQVSDLPTTFQLWWIIESAWISRMHPPNVGTLVGSSAHHRKPWHLVCQSLSLASTLLRIQLCYFDLLLLSWDNPKSLYVQRWLRSRKSTTMKLTWASGPLLRMAGLSSPQCRLPYNLQTTRNQTSIREILQGR